MTRGTTFTVIEPAAVPASPTPARPRLPRLAYLERGWTSSGAYEPVRAGTETEDGEREWLFERMEDGTWACGHMPSEAEVKRGLKTLTACRAYAGSGKARKDLERIQAHERGEHQAGRDRACPRC